MDADVKSLTIAIILQAVKDYFSVRTNDKKRAQILKDLRSPYMDLITDGQSVIVAEQLELHPAEIEARLRKSNENMV